MTSNEPFDLARLIPLSLREATLVGESGVAFHLRELVGEGAQGWVFRARYDDPEGIWVVVKVLRNEGFGDEARLRFEREAQVLQQLGASKASTPNVVRFYDHGLHRLMTPYGEIELPFTVLELVEGPTLATLLDDRAGQPPELRWTFSILKQIARALGTVHDLGLVHRDLKPSNVLVAIEHGESVAKVTDFGLVKVTGNQNPMLTGRLAGASPGYAPPEQYEAGNARVTLRTDVFAYAAVAYELLSGRQAFPHRPGDNPLRTVARMLGDARPTLESASAALPIEIRDRADIVCAIDRELGRALSPEPGDRQESVRELWARLESLIRRALDAGAGQARTPAPVALVEEPSHAGPAIDSRKAPESVVFRFRTVANPIENDVLRAASVCAADGTIDAIGAGGVYRFALGRWQRILDRTPVALLGLTRLRTGELFAYGERGTAGIVRDGAFTQVVAADEGVTWLGAFADDGDVVLVGEQRRPREGVLLEIRTRSHDRRQIEGTERIHAVTRLSSGALLCAGAEGVLVEIREGRIREVPWRRSGHLYSVARTLDGGALVVGSGGHALAVRPNVQPVGPLRALVEAVQTTRDLVSVATDRFGVGWAGGANGRVLRRSERGWERIPFLTTGANLIAIGSVGSSLLVVGDDGSVHEGREAKATTAR